MSLGVAAVASGAASGLAIAIGHLKHALGLKSSLAAPAGTSKDNQYSRRPGVTTRNNLISQQGERERGRTALLCRLVLLEDVRQVRQ
ncbi:hypothetical protein [Kibdelosporangium philippinense]|uniref:hypothetical protein n=1 Tax=Kibdelosporangium philippinense TaxID=211113 RepID=UPI00360DF626